MIINNEDGYINFFYHKCFLYAKKQKDGFKSFKIRSLVFSSLLWTKFDFDFRTNHHLVLRRPFDFNELLLILPIWLIHSSTFLSLVLQIKKLLITN